MKKVVNTVIILLLFAYTCGCQVYINNEKPKLTADIPDCTGIADVTNVEDTQASLSTTDTKLLFQQELQQSYTLLLGTYLRMEKNSEEPNEEFFRFTVERVYWGKMQEQEIVLTMPLTNRAKLEVGQQYLVPVIYSSGIYMPAYKYSSWAQIPVNNDGSLGPFQINGLDADLPFQTVEECISYCGKIVDLSKNGSIGGWPYTVSEDLTEIMQDAPCVFIGYFTEVDIEINRDHMKKFNVTAYLKGEIPEGAYAPTNEDGNEAISLIQNYELKEVTNNTPYILACAYSYSGRPTCCVFARKNAVIPLSDTERVNEVYAALGIEPEK